MTFMDVLRDTYGRSMSREAERSLKLWEEYKATDDKERKARVMELFLESEARIERDHQAIMGHLRRRAREIDSSLLARMLGVRVPKELL